MSDSRTPPRTSDHTSTRSDRSLACSTPLMSVTRRVDSYDHRLRADAAGLDRELPTFELSNRTGSPIVVQEPRVTS